MKIVIDIPDNIMEYLRNNGCLSVIYIDEVAKAIINGTPYKERPQGEWLDDDSYYANCSCCGYQIDTHYERGYLNFCPNCGADMRGERR